MATFYVPSVNLIGKGVVNEVGPYIKELGHKKALLVTDKFIEGSDILPKVLKPLDAEGIEYVIFSDVEPNPTCKNVTDGVAALKDHGCDFIISLGGGSPQDAAVVSLSSLQMVSSHRTTKVFTSLLKKGCQWLRSIQQLELLQKLRLTMSLLTKNARSRW